MKQTLTLLIVLLACSLWAGEQNLLVNPSFNDGVSGWDSIWMRDLNAGETSLVKGALRVVYRGNRDWSVGQSRRTPVRPGEVYEFSGRVKVQEGAGAAQLSVVTRDGASQVMEWMYGLQQVAGAGDWRSVKARFVVPASCATVQFRLTGWGVGSFLFDDNSLIRLREAPQGVELKTPVTAASSGLTLIIDPATRLLHMTSASGASFDFDMQNIFSSVVSVKSPSPDRMDLLLVNPMGSEINATLRADESYAVLSLKGEGPMLGDYAFPGPILSKAGQSWVLPVNEGLIVPADDKVFQTWDMVLYGGHGLCMPFVGLTDGEEGLLAVAETQDDASVHYTAPQGDRTSTFTFNWQPSQESWSYERVLRLVPVKGGHVAVAKAYREYAREKGLLVSLKDKAKTVPQVDRLIGAVNLWWWGDAPRWTQDNSGAADFGETLVECGIRRVLWSHEQMPDTVDRLNKLGFLTGRYDIYQDVWGPENPHSWTNKDGWPDDLVLLSNGDWMRGWVDRDSDGREYPGGVLCSSRALLWEKKNVPADMKTHAYGARFIDTTTASPLRECYSKKHPLSRSDDHRNKMGLLSYLSRDLKLVTGSETGVDMAVPSVHYFEGMMSLGPYRLPDAGYDLTTYKPPSDDFKTFQLGPKYRIPLFELVYHDCVVSSWYWGDSSNRVPELWDERDMFNALYGTIPLWILDPAIWEKNKARFVRSYRNATSVARATGYSEMTDHAFLTPDHTMQSSAFADGTRVWANFGVKPCTVRKGVTVAPRSFRAEFPDGSVLVP